MLDDCCYAIPLPVGDLVIQKIVCFQFVIGEENKKWE